jgi:glycosyltransferase involved in cell wall biosynthesis
MRVLLVHNKYQLFGGEDVVFAHEGALLAKAGVDVRRLEVSNGDISTAFDKVRAAALVASNPLGVRQVIEALDREQPDVVHVHNVFPLLTPSIFAACRARGKAVVHTLHNYRVVCANAVLMRDGHVCEDCLTHGPWEAVKHRCYRNSAVASAAVARAIHLHQRRGTWRRDVDRFIALSHFARRLFIRAGFPAEKIIVKPNCTPDPGPPDAAAPRADFLFVGRLSPEKGVDSLLAAFDGLPASLTVIGDGPERRRLQAMAGPNVRFAGQLAPPQIAAEMARARALLTPSIWYEGSALVVVEAFAQGLPVIASAMGALPELVTAGETGLIVPPGDAAALAQAVMRLQSDPAEAARLGLGARRAYETSYSPDVTVAALLDVYEEALHAHLAASRIDGQERFTARW